MEQEAISDGKLTSNRMPSASANHAVDTQDLSTLPSRTDVAIIGGGIAGLIASIVLARHGLKVLLCEKKSYPRDKVCGACLNANALATLEQLQLSFLLDQLNAPHLNQVQIQCGPRTLKLPLPSGRAITRREFDLALATEAARCGVDLQENVTASLDSLTSDQKFRKIKLQSPHAERELEASLVFVAAGLSGVRENSLPWPALIQHHSKIGMGLNFEANSHNIQSHTIHLCVRRQGYLGIVCAENNQLNLAAAIDPELLKQEKSFGAWVRGTLHQYDLSIDFPLEEAPWRGTPTLTRNIPQPYGRRWLAIGDSAGYVEPFTGEGMAWAMAGGAIAASLVIENLASWDIQHERQWGSLYQQLIRHRQFSCRSLAWLLQNSLRSRIAIEAAAWFPALGRWFVTNINRNTNPALHSISSHSSQNADAKD